MSDSSDIELAAAELRADAQEAPALVEALATWLEGAVPHLVEVERKRAGWRGSRKLVTRISCRVGDDMLVLERDGRTVQTRRAKTVRGIVLKSETLTLGEFVTELTTTLVREAQLNASSLDALRELLV